MNTPQQMKENKGTPISTGRSGDSKSETEDQREIPVSKECSDKVANKGADPLPSSSWGESGPSETRQQKGKRKSYAQTVGESSSSFNSEAESFESSTGTRGPFLPRKDQRKKQKENKAKGPKGPASKVPKGPKNKTAGALQQKALGDAIMTMMGNVDAMREQNRDAKRTEEEKARANYVRFLESLSFDYERNLGLWLYDSGCHNYWTASSAIVSLIDRFRLKGLIITWVDRPKADLVIGRCPVESPPSRIIWPATEITPGVKVAFYDQIFTEEDYELVRSGEYTTSGRDVDHLFLTRDIAAEAPSPFPALSNRFALVAAPPQTVYGQVSEMPPVETLWIDHQLISHVKAHRTFSEMTYSTTINTMNMSRGCPTYARHHPELVNMSAIHYFELNRNLWAQRANLCSREAQHEDALAERVSGLTFRGVGLSATTVRRMWYHGSALVQEAYAALVDQYSSFQPSVIVRQFVPESLSSNEKEKEPMSQSEACKSPVIMPRRNPPDNDDPPSKDDNKPALRVVLSSASSSSSEGEQTPPRRLWDDGVCRFVMLDEATKVETEEMAPLILESVETVEIGEETWFDEAMRILTYIRSIDPRFEIMILYHLPDYLISYLDSLLQSWREDRRHPGWLVSNNRPLVTPDQWVLFAPLTYAFSSLLGSVALQTCPNPDGFLQDALIACLLPQIQPFLGMLPRLDIFRPALRYYENHVMLRSWLEQRSRVDLMGPILTCSNLFWMKRKAFAIDLEEAENGPMTMYLIPEGGAGGYTERPIFCTWQELEEGRGQDFRTSFVDATQEAHESLGKDRIIVDIEKYALKTGTFSEVWYNLYFRRALCFGQDVTLLVLLRRLGRETPHPEEKYLQRMRYVVKQLSFPRLEEIPENETIDLSLYSSYLENMPIKSRRKHLDYFVYRCRPDSRDIVARVDSAFTKGDEVLANPKGRIIINPPPDLFYELITGLVQFKKTVKRSLFHLIHSDCGRRIYWTYGADLTGQQKGNWRARAEVICRDSQDWTACLIVGGDDNLCLFGRRGELFAWESDVTACDQSHNAHLIGNFVFVLTRMGFSQEFLQALQASYLRPLRVKNTADVHFLEPQLHTGHPQTSIANTMVVSIVACYLITSALFPEGDEPLDSNWQRIFESDARVCSEGVGMVWKVEAHAQPQFATFHKGFWVSSRESEGQVWLPLPSCLWKCAKIRTQSRLSERELLHRMAFNYYQRLLMPNVAFVRKIALLQFRYLMNEADGMVPPNMNHVTQGKYFEYYQRLENRKGLQVDQSLERFMTMEEAPFWDENEVSCFFEQRYGMQPEAFWGVFPGGTGIVHSVFMERAIERDYCSDSTREFFSKLYETTAEYN